MSRRDRSQRSASPRDGGRSARPAGQSDRAAVGVGAAAVAGARILPFRPRGLVVPQLDEAVLRQGGATGGPQLTQLALAMLDAGIGGPEAWSWSGRTAAGFIERALARWVAEHVCDRFGEYFSLLIRLDTSLGPWAASQTYAGGPLFLALEPTQAGYAVMGPVFTWLETFDPRLPATLYRDLLAINAVGGVFDWHSAIEHHEMRWDGYDSSDPEYADAIETRPSLPPQLEGRKPLTDPEVARRRRRWPADVRAIVDAGRRLREAGAALARRKPRKSDTALLDAGGNDYDLGWPYPILCVVGEERDQIEAAFDDLMMCKSGEACAPCSAWIIQRPTVREVRRAFDRLAQQLRVLDAAAQLFDAIPGKAKDDPRSLAGVLAARDHAATQPLAVRIPA